MPDNIQPPHWKASDFPNEDSGPARDPQKEAEIVAQQMTARGELMQRFSLSEPKSPDQIKMEQRLFKLLVNIQRILHERELRGIKSPKIETLSEEELDEIFQTSPQYRQLVKEYTRLLSEYNQDYPPTPKFED